MQSLEIAVFEAADPDGFAHKQAKLHRTLASSFDGYIGSLGLRSLSEPMVYVDAVLWESTEKATVAADAAQASKEFAWFRDELAAIRFFDHLTPAREATASLAAVGAAAVVEVALVKPSGLEGFAAAHSELHRALRAADVVVEELRLEVNKNGVGGDLNGWTHPTAMEEFAPKMMARPDLAPMFDPENEVLLFMPFETNFAS